MRGRKLRWVAARVEDIPALIRHFQRNMPGETKCRYDDAAPILGAHGCLVTAGRVIVTKERD